MKENQVPLQKSKSGDKGKKRRKRELKKDKETRKTESNERVEDFKSMNVLPIKFVRDLYIILLIIYILHFHHMIVLGYEDMNTIKFVLSRLKESRLPFFYIAGICPVTFEFIIQIMN